MRGKHSVLAVAICACLTIGAAATPAIAAPAAPPTNGRIFYDKVPFRHEERVVSILPDGTDPIVAFLASKYWGMGYRMALSPDGSRIAIAQDHEPRDGSAWTSRLVIVDAADGGNPSIVFPGQDTFYASVNWSSDATALLFTRMSMRPGHSGYHLYSSGLDGTGLTRMGHGQMIDADMSPDGSTVAFRDGQERLGVLDVALATQTLLVESGRIFYPGWSPDGSTIAFSWARVGAPSSDVYTISADGLTRARLTATRKPWEGWLAWSPDGLQLVYTADDWSLDIHDLWTIAADGTGATQITDDGAYEYFPMWAPA
ncbi:MAG: hypothetical protein ABI572_04650 [Actinomycetota bacterium]